MAYIKQEFKGPSFQAKDLAQRWDRAVLASEHFRQTAPTVTDDHYRRVVRNMLRRWVPKPGAIRVLKLDLYNEATGTSHTGHFVEARARVVGIDVSYQVTRRAHLKCAGQILGIQGDVRDLPFQENSFDVVFSLGTLEHVQDADQPGVIGELFRVIRPGGMCILGVNNRYSLWLTPLLFEFIEYAGLTRGQWSYEPTYPPGHLKTLFQREGFAHLRTDGTLLFPKWLRVYDLWSASRTGRFFAGANALKNLVYRPLVWGIERLESLGILNYFADQTLTIGIKPS